MMRGVGTQDRTSIYYLYCDPATCCGHPACLEVNSDFDGVAQEEQSGDEKPFWTDIDKHLPVPPGFGVQGVGV